MERASWIIIMIFSVTITLIAVSTLSYTSVITQNLEKDLLEQKITTVKFVGIVSESFFDKLITTLDLSSKRVYVKSVNYTNFVSENLRGIPEDVDMPKRRAAQEIRQKISEEPRRRFYKRFLIWTQFHLFYQMETCTLLSHILIKKI